MWHLKQKWQYFSSAHFGVQLRDISLTIRTARSTLPADLRDKHLSFLSQAVSSRTAGYNPWLFSLQVTVILENLFDPDEIIAEPTLLKDLDADIKEESATLGPVEKVESSSESFYLGRFVSQDGRPFLPASMRLCTTERVRERSCSLGVNVM